MKIFKTILIIVLVVGVAAVFYGGTTGLNFKAEAPLGVFNHLQEAPDASLAATSKYQISGDNALDGGYDAQKTDIDRALFLLYTATFNEATSDYYAYMTKAEGTADYAGLGGLLKSNSAHIKDSASNFEYHRWINALTDVSVPETLKFIAPLVRTILATATETVIYNGTDFNRRGKPGQTEYDKQFDYTTAAWQTSITQTKIEKALPHKELTTIAEAFSKDYDLETYSKYWIKSYVNFYTLIHDKKLNPIKDVSIKLVKDKDSGQEYYDVKLVGNVDEINKDPDTLDAVKNANSPASKITFAKYNFNFQVWKDSAMFRLWETTEDWNGVLEVGGLQLAAKTNMVNPTYYTYNAEDIRCDGYLAGFDIAKK